MPQPQCAVRSELPNIFYLDGFSKPWGEINKFIPRLGFEPTTFDALAGVGQLH